MTMTNNQIFSKTRYKKTSDENYQQIQELYASIGRMYQIHFVNGTYTREFFENYVNAELATIAELESQQ